MKSLHFLKHRVPLSALLITLCLNVITFNMWGAENDTHDFAQSISQLLNYSATISSVNIAAQSYPIKKVSVTVSYNKTAGGAEISVTVGGTTFGKATTHNKNGSATYDFEGTATTGAVVVTFTNKCAYGTGKGTFKCTNVMLTEGSSGGGGGGSNYTVDCSSITGSGSVTGCGDFEEDEEVTLTVTPTNSSTTYVESVTAYNGDSWDELSVTRIDATHYSFTMPAADVYVYTTFAAIPSYRVTYKVPTCVTSPTNNATLTSQSVFANATPSIAGYKFEGWVTSAITGTQSSKPATVYKPGEYLPSNNQTYYALYSTVSATFTKQSSSSAITAGNYMLCSAYSTTARVIKNVVDANKRATTTEWDCSGTTTTCTDWSCIWVFEQGTDAYSGYWFIYNPEVNKYLGAASTDNSVTSGTTNYQVALVDTKSDASAWSCSVSSGRVTLTNKWRTANATAAQQKLFCSSNYAGFGYSSNSSPYLFKNDAITASYTTNPTCPTTDHTITFNANGGSGTMSAITDIADGSNQTLTTNAFTKSGCTFGGWTADVAVTVGGSTIAVGNTIANQATIQNITSDITLTAIWTPNPYRLDVASVANVVITATPASGSAIAEGANANVDFGKTVTLNCSSLTSGYTFSGWTVYKTDDSNTTVSVSGSGNGATFTMPAYAVTVSATITPPWVYFTNCSSTLKIHYNANTSDASVANMPTDNNEYAANAYVSIPNTTPTRTGYTFDKWFTNDACTTPVGGYAVNTSNAFQITSTTTLYAHWNPISYSVRFNKNDNSATGTMSDESFDYDESKALTSNGFTLSGKTFIGWATSENGDVVYTDGQTVSNLSSTNGAVVDLYAKWATTYTVTYSVATGDATAPSPHTAITPGSSVTLKSHTSTLTCAKFIGWYAGSSYTDTSKPSSNFYTAGASYTPTADITLKAVYAIVGDNYELVTDVSDLSVGSQVVIAAVNYDKALGATNGTVCSAISITKTGTTITFDDEDGVSELLLEEGSASGYYAFKIDNNYLRGNSSANNLFNENSVTDNSSFSISISSGGVSTITGKYTGGRNIMSYNYNNGTDRFACYNSIQGTGEIAIYQKAISSYTTSPSCVSYTVTLAVTCHASGSAKIGSVATAATLSTSQSTTVSGAGSVRIKDIAAVAGYNYTVTQTSGTTATLTDNGDGTFTVSGLSSDATFTVTYSAKPTYDITFDVGTAGTGTYSKLTAYNGKTVTIPAGYTPTSSCGIFVGWSPGVKATTGSRPATIITAGGSYTHATDGAIVMYAVYSFTGGCTQEFALGRSGDYYMTGEYSSTKYYATGFNSSNYCYANTEANLTTHPASTFHLTYDATKTAAIGVSGKYAYLISVTDNEHSEEKGYWRNNYTSSLTFDDTPQSDSYWTLEAMTGGYKLTSASTYANTIGNNGSNFNTRTATALNFEVAGGVSYYTDYSCGSSTVDVTFDWSGTLTWPTGKTASSYTNLARCSDVTEFPTATYDGWTFLGWSTTEYNDTYSSYLDAEYNSYTEDPGSNTLYSTSGNHLTLGTANVTLYPVFTKYPDNEDFDIDAGGDYYIYYYKDADFFKDTYYSADSHLTRMYATNYPSSGGAMDETSSCASAQLFNFSKRSDGYWNIRLKKADGTYPTKSYVTNTSDNNFDKAVAAEPSYGWDITSGSGGSYIIRYRGNPGNWSGGSVGSGNWQTYYNIKAYQSGSVMSFKCYNEDQAGSTTYKAVYLGSCEERLYSSNPTITPHVYISGEIKVTSTAGQLVKATSTLTVSGSNLSTASVTISSDKSAFKFSKTGASGSFTNTVTVDVESRRVSPTTIYVAYQPTLTTDGIEEATITVSDGAGTPTTASTAEHAIQGRHLTEDVAIVAKVDDKWIALPSVMKGVTPHAGDLVFVNNVSDPTTVTYAMTSDVWHLRQVASGTRFTNHGYAATFVNGDGNTSGTTADYPLFATTSSSGTGIGFDAKYSGYNNTNPRQYEWKLESSDLKTYTLVVDSGVQTNKTLTYKSSEGRWGVYGSGAASITDVRILPVTNKLTDLGYSVIEWHSSNQIAVAGLTSSASSGKIAYKVVADQAVTSMSSINEVNYDLATGDIGITSSSLSSFGAGKLLIFFDAKSSPTKMSVIEIPFISSGTINEKSGMNTTTNLTSGSHNGKNIVVANGGTVTIPSTGISVKDITIYGGGKLVINDNTTTTGKITMRGGYSYIDNSFKMPQLYIAPGITFSGSSTVAYDYVIDNTFYYWLAVPYPVNLANATDEIGNTAFKSWVQYYDGEQRASGDQVTGWKKFTGSNFEVGKGYTVAAKVRQGDDNLLVKDRKYAYIHLPLNNSGALLSNPTTGELSTTKSVEVTAPGFTAGEKNSGLKDNNVGWNLLGNPFVTKYKLADASGTFAVGTLEKTMNGSIWTGDYHWENTSYRYITLPKTLNSDEYVQQKVSDAVIEAFFPFFIQVKNAGTLTFANSGTTNRQSMPAYRIPQASQREVSIDLNLESETDIDNTGLLIGNNFTEGYEFGDDLVKMMNSSQLAVYSIMGGQNLAFNALSEESALKPIPLGYRAPKAGTYLFRLSDNIDLSEVESIILTDYDEGISTDMVYGDYEFESKAGNYTSRFAITVELRAPHIHTGDELERESGALDNLHIQGENSQITIAGLPDGAEVYVYDMTGKLAARNTANDTRLHIAVPHGIYNVRVISTEGNATTKVIVD